MKRFDLTYPCRADFGAMSTTTGGRFCDECEKVVHDLSAMSERQARELLARTPRERVCVRYVYEADSGQVVFGARAENRTRLVPEHQLLRRLKSRVAIAAVLASPLLVEACGGNDGNYRDRSGDPRLEEPDAEVANALENDPDGEIDVDGGTNDETLPPDFADEGAAGAPGDAP